MGEIYADRFLSEGRSFYGKLSAVSRTISGSNKFCPQTFLELTFISPHPAVTLLQCSQLVHLSNSDHRAGPGN